MERGTHVPPSTCIKAYVLSTYQKPAYQNLDPGKGKTTYVPHTSKLQGGWDVGRLGFTIISVPQNQSVFILITWVPSPCKQEPTFLADEPWYRP